VRVAPYRFLTTWIFDAPIEEVWERLDDPMGWPRWWRGVESTETLGDDHWRSTWRSFLPYSLTFDFAVDYRERPNVLGGRAAGELAGTGVWRLFEARGLTASNWDWRVGTTAPWMNVLGPVARPAFAWNHGWIMRRGGEGLARDLGCSLVAAS
jgi:carbon monoxide dehydrogenase subunit G